MNFMIARLTFYIFIAFVGVQTDAKDFQSPPQRVISLVPSISEWICALNLCNRIVGVDQFSDYPSTLQALPHVGDYYSANIEAIIRLHPDIVFLSGQSSLAKRLNELGIKTQSFKSETFNDMYNDITLLGKIFQVDPKPLWQTTQQNIYKITSKYASTRKPSSVYIEVDATPYAASEQSYIGYLAAQLHLNNIVPASMGSFPQISPEWVVQKMPDLIIRVDASASLAPKLEQRNGWSVIPAVKNHHICTLSAKEATIVGRPGPRIDQALQILTQCVP